MIKSTRRGFTLIELLVVIAIIGILSSVVIASMNSARRKSRDARRISDIANIKTALEMYYDGNQEYPEALSSLAPQYIPSEPKDPSDNTTSYSYANLDNAGGACDAAATAGTCNKYHLGANLEDSANTALDSDADVCAAAGAGCTAGSEAAGTTISGIDGGGATGNDCVGAGTAVYCYDVTN